MWLHRISPRVAPKRLASRGTLAETITVTGETPIVDTQSVRRQTTISSDLITGIPSARSYAGLMTLMPNTVVATGAASDVQVVPGMVVFGGAGGRANEGRLQLDGISVGSAFNGGGSRRTSPTSATRRKSR